MKWSLEEIFSHEGAWWSALQTLRAPDGLAAQVRHDLEFYLALREHMNRKDTFVNEARGAFRDALKGLHSGNSDMPDLLEMARKLCEKGAKEYRALLGLPFRQVVGANGDVYSLNVSSCGYLLRHPDPTVRRGAQIEWNATLKGNSAHLHSRFLEHFRSAPFQALYKSGARCGFSPWASDWKNIAKLLLPARRNGRAHWSDFLYLGFEGDTRVGLDLGAVLQRLVSAFGKVDAESAESLRLQFSDLSNGRIHDTSNSDEGLANAECFTSKKFGPWVKVRWDGSLTGSLLFAHEMGHAFEAEIRKRRGEDLLAGGEFMSSLAEWLLLRELGVQWEAARTWSVTRFVWQVQLAVFQDSLMAEPPSSDPESSDSLMVRYQKHLEEWFGHAFKVPSDAGSGVFGCTPLLVPHGPRRYAIDWALAGSHVRLLEGASAGGWNSEVSMPRYVSCSTDTAPSAPLLPSNAAIWRFVFENTIPFDGRQLGRTTRAPRNGNASISIL